MTDLVERLHGMIDMSVASDDGFNRLTPAGFRLLRQTHDALEAAQAQAAEVRRAAAEVKAACGAYLGDETMEQILFGDMDDEKTGTATFQLGRLRRVRAAIRALTDAAKER